MVFHELIKSDNHLGSYNLFKPRWINSKMHGSQCGELWAVFLVPGKLSLEELRLSIDSLLRAHKCAHAMPRTKMQHVNL